MIKIETIGGESRYIVELPEHGVRQEANSGTRLPFASEAAAQAWQDEFVGAVDAHRAAAATAAAEKDATEKAAATAEAAARQVLTDLAAIDAETGMSRLQRETLLAIAGTKAPAKLSEAEAKAAILRAKKVGAA